MDDATRTLDEANRALLAVARGLRAGHDGRENVVDGVRATHARAHDWLAGYAAALDARRAAGGNPRNELRPPPEAADGHASSGWAAGLQGNVAYAQAVLDELRLSGAWLAGASRGEAARRLEARPETAPRR
jgi:hypothetical protein